MIPDSTFVLGLDLDGVVADLCAGFRRCGERITGQRFVVVDKSAYSLTERFGVPDHVIDEVFTTGSDTGDLYTDMPPLLDRIAQVRHLHDELGWQVHVVTARSLYGNPAITEQATRWWLDHHDVPYDALTLTSDKHAVEGLDVLADDTPSMVDRVHECHGRRAAVLVDADWNQDRVDLPRITDLTEIAAMVSGAAA